MRDSRWRSWAQRNRLEEFVKLGRMTKKHEEGIVAIFEHQGVTNGPMEAINGKVQQAKGRARGYRNIDKSITVIFLIAESDASSGFALEDDSVSGSHPLIAPSLLIAVSDPRSSR